MDFWASSEGQLFIGVSVGLIAVGAAYFLFSSKKPKGLHFNGGSSLGVAPCYGPSINFNSPYQDHGSAIVAYGVRKV
ncbi:hypothetical protein OROHE_011465 [Orobanche hederae]